MQFKNIVRLNAAGGGKTYTISQEASNEALLRNDNKKILLVTYTREGVNSIREEIQKRNYGIIPKNIKVLTWFTFLLDDMIKPYQSYITDINSIVGIFFGENKINFYKFGEKERYITSSNNVRQKEVSNLVILLNSKSNGQVLKRLENMYSHIFFDEIQDIAGTDLDILKLLFKSKIKITCVGDNKQATFATHRTAKNKNKTGIKLWESFSILEKQGVIKQEFSLETKRCNDDICKFANIIFPNENNIYSSMNAKTNHDGIFLIEKKDFIDYFNFFSPVILKYDKKTKIINNLFSYNFGMSKGKTFDRILIFPNKPFIEFLKGKKIDSPTRYYIAVTRAKYSIAIVVDKFSTYLNFINDSIQIKTKNIDVMKFQISKSAIL